jgi:hypothetical protein
MLEIKGISTIAEKASAPPRTEYVCCLGCSGTPVLASRIDGNLGLLGADYAGVFEAGDAQGLAHLLLTCRTAQNKSGLMAHLSHQCALRAPLFEPQAERAALHQWVQDLWTH